MNNAGIHGAMEKTEREGIGKQKRKGGCYLNSFEAVEE